jgi:hypothetical protein
MTVYSSVLTLLALTDVIVIPVTDFIQMVGGAMVNSYVRPLKRNPHSISLSNIQTLMSVQRARTTASNSVPILLALSLVTVILAIDLPQTVTAAMVSLYSYWRVNNDIY